MLELDGWCCLDLATVGNPLLSSNGDRGIELELEQERTPWKRALTFSLLLLTSTQWECKLVYGGGWWMCGRGGDGKRIHVLLTFVHEWFKKVELAVRMGLDPRSRKPGGLDSCGH